MSHKLQTLPFDETLTRANAYEKGYRWLMNVVRNEQGQIELLHEIQHMTQEEGYKLGQPDTSDDPQYVPYGIYKPVTPPAQQEKKV